MTISDITPIKTKDSTQLKAAEPSVKPLIHLKDEQRELIVYRGLEERFIQALLKEWFGHVS